MPPNFDDGEAPSFSSPRMARNHRRCRLPARTQARAMLRVAASLGSRPSERSAAIAARAAATSPQVSPEISGESWNAPNALVPGGSPSPQAPTESFNFSPDQDENLILRPNLNKVRLPNPTSFAKAESGPVKPVAGPAKATRSVEPEVSNPLTSEPDVSPDRMGTSPSPKPEPVDESFTNSTQLALQVIFGYEGDLSRQEVLDLAKDLDGVKEVKLVGGPEAAAMRILKESAEKFGYGGEHGLILRSRGYPVEYVGDDKVCLCVVLEQPVLPKGTREKLTLIAREAARLG
jgi:hypothetical protein